MKASFKSTMNTALDLDCTSKIHKVKLGKDKSITIFHAANGTRAFTVALPGTDNSIVHFYRYGVNKRAPEKLYRSETLYSAKEDFEYSDWLIRTVSDTFQEADEIFEKIIGI